MPECELCGNSKDLRDSHVIPRFVFKYIKKTGATPFLRTATDPDTRVQDHTEELLCPDCEQDINQYEAPFAGNIFHPYMQDQPGSLDYDRWLQKFIISVNWRLMISELAEWQELPTYYRDSVEDARDTWHDILTSSKSLEQDPYAHHVIFLDELELRTSDEDLPEKWEFYRDRATDGTIVEGSGVHYYFKFPRIAFISCIQPPELSGFHSTKTSQSGTLEKPQRVPEEWESFFINRARRILENSAPDESDDRPAEWMKERPERAAESETLRAWAEGKSREIENHDPTNYLDEDCPVCFTDHRVIESLPPRPITRSEAEELKDGFEFFKPIYFEGDLAHPDASPNEAPTIVQSTQDKTYQIALYSDVGWVVEKEIDLVGEMDPEEMGNELWEATHGDYAEFAEEHS